ncbi:MAG TPA: flagellar hook-basal body complex protein [bacterium]|nr:flagellar hook-basal body complex protein [bacterium]
MMRGLYSGVSGLLNHQTRMDVIGNNISNINTVGYKKSDVVFQDFLSQLIEIAHAPENGRGGTGPMQIGLGSSIGSIDKVFTQGSLNRTNNPLDVAIQGNGFFVINDGVANYYTRAGHFSLDSEGNIVMAPGLKLQGWMATRDPITGEMRISSSTEPIGDLQIKTGQVIPAKETTTVTFNGNLNSQNKVAIEPIVVEWSSGDPVSPTISKIKIEFEHAHPSLPYYIWKATWYENPPSGYSVGSAVIDANTGEAASGIIEVNQYGQVVNNYINTNQNWVVNASEPIEASSNRGTVALDQVFVRNQDDCTKALWQIRFAQLPDGSFDSTRYYVRVSFDNGNNWHNVNDVVDGLGNTLDDSAYRTSGTALGLGDTTKTTIFTYVDNSSGSNYMAAQITIPAYMWSGTAAAGDVISFTTQKSDNTTAFTQVLNLPNEKPKLEDEWGQFVASKPLAAGTNNPTSGYLSRVIANVGMKADDFVANLQNSSLNSNGLNVAGASNNDKFQILFTSATNFEVYKNGTSIGTGDISTDFNAGGLQITAATAWTAANAVSGDSFTFTVSGGVVTNLSRNLNTNLIQVDNSVSSSSQFKIQFSSNPASTTTYAVYDLNENLIGTGSTSQDFYKSGVYIPASAWTVANIQAGDSWVFNVRQVDNHPSSYVIKFNDATTYTIYKLGLQVSDISKSDSATTFDTTKISFDENVAANTTFKIEFTSATDYNIYKNDVLIGVGSTAAATTVGGMTIDTGAFGGASLGAGDEFTFVARTLNIDPSLIVYDASGTDTELFYDGVELTSANLIAIDTGNITSDYKATPTAEDPISIPWTNWHGTFKEGDVFTFQTHATRSNETGFRDFFRVKDAGGYITEIFIPSGSITGADPLTFEPNTTETTTPNDSTFYSATNPTPNARALSGNPVTAKFNNRDEYQYVTSVNVYDSLGKAHTLNITFEKKTTNLWMWSVLDPDPVDANNVKLAGYGLLAFKEDGSYDPSNSITFESEVGLNNADANGPISFKGIYFDPPDWGGAPLPGEGAKPVMITPVFTDLVQFAADNDGEVYSQDGYAKGTLTEFAINAFGVITGFYDNGHALDIGQIALANFNNANGLMSIGGSLYRETSNSGMSRIGTAGTAGRGTFAAGNLEQSNVEMAEEFTNMIVTQRGFQANARTISTADQMLQELISLKR